MTPLELENLLLATPLPGSGLLIQALLLAFVLGLVIAALYRYSLSDRPVSPAVLATFAILPMVSAMVLLVIGNSLARAFTLVGALAIVRFRTRTQSPWDITFVFMALAVGVACGITAFQIAIIGTAIIGLAILGVGVLPGMAPKTDLFNLRCDVAAHESAVDRLNPVIERFASRHWLDEVRSLRFGETLSLSWRIRLRPGKHIAGLVQELSVLEGVERVRIASGEELTEDAG